MAAAPQAATGLSGSVLCSSGAARTRGLASKACCGATKTALLDGRLAESVSIIIVALLVRRPMVLRHHPFEPAHRRRRLVSDLSCLQIASSVQVHLGGQGRRGRRLWRLWRRPARAPEVVSWAPWEEGRPLPLGSAQRHGAARRALRRCRRRAREFAKGAFEQASAPAPRRGPPALS